MHKATPYGRNGIAITNTSGFVITQGMVSDDQGGVIVFWNKYSPGNYIYAQRIKFIGQ